MLHEVSPENTYFPLASIQISVSFQNLCTQSLLDKNSESEKNVDPISMNLTVGTEDWDLSRSLPAHLPTPPPRCTRRKRFGSPDAEDQKDSQNRQIIVPLSKHSLSQ